MSKNFEFPEGATPLADCSGLIPAWVQNLTDLNRVEAENISLAQRKYLRSPVDDPARWLHVKGLKLIHQTMFGNVWDWAGEFRKSITSIGIKLSLIPTQLAEFCSEILSWSRHPVELTFLEKAVRLHSRLAAIHPFENGNGRFSRLVADRFLLAWKCPHPLWPDELNQESGARDQYIKAIKSADTGDFEPLLSLMQTLGAKDPHVDELRTNPFYRTRLNNEQLLMIEKALQRRSKFE